MPLLAVNRPGDFPFTIFAHYSIQGAPLNSRKSYTKWVFFEREPTKRGICKEASIFLYKELHRSVLIGRSQIPRFAVSLAEEAFHVVFSIFKGVSCVILVWLEPSNSYASNDVWFSDKTPLTVSSSQFLWNANTTSTCKITKS